MPTTKLQKHLPHRPEDLIAFVSDVEGYPKFINVISAIRVLGGRKRDGAKEQFEAEMGVTYKFLSERVRCTVTVDHQAKTVVVRKSGNEGALKNLVNDWTFHELSDGSTLVDFYVDVTLKSAPLNFLAKSKFAEVTDKIMAVFIKRASQVCPKVGGNIDVYAEAKALGIKARI